MVLAIAPEFRVDKVDEFGGALLASRLALELSSSIALSVDGYTRGVDEVSQRPIGFAGERPIVEDVGRDGAQRGGVDVEDALELLGGVGVADVGLELGSR